MNLRPILQNMRKKRTTYTAAFKAKVVLAAAKQDKTLSQLAAPFQVHPRVIAKWKSKLLNHVETLFQDSRMKKKTDDTNTHELYQQISQLDMEKDWLKKSEQFR